MDLTQLRTFVAVAQEGHMTRAAERLHISQPAASAHIRALESYFELPLFIRTNRCLELTPAGRMLADRARQVLDCSVELVSLARELRGQIAGRVVIGSNGDPDLNRLGPLAIALSTQYPLIDLSVEVRGSMSIREGVMTGELDAGFLLAPALAPGLSCRVLASVGFKVAGPAAWREKIINANLQELAAMPWVVTPPGSSNWDLRQRTLHTFGVPTCVAIETASPLLMREFIKDGMGLGMVRQDLAEEGERRGWFALSPLPVAPMSMFFIYSESRQDDPVIRSLADLVASIWAT